MSKNEPKSFLITSDIEGWFIAAVVDAGGVLLQNSGKGQFHFELDNVAYAVTVVKPAGPLQDLSGKDKITKLRE